HHEGIPAARVPHAAARTGRDAHDAARRRLEPAFRSSDEHHRRAHEPVAQRDRQGLPQAAHSHRAGRGLCSEGMSSKERPPSRMRLSSARLASLFVLIFAAGVTLVLTAVYFLTARVLDREVDAVINAEVTHLVDDYARGGLLQLVSTLRRRADSWGRFGAV